MNAPMRMRPVMVMVMLIAPGLAYAQVARDYAAEARRNVGDDASSVCAGCTWQRDTSGWVAKAAPVLPVLTSAPEPPAGCDNINAYARPDEALACVLASLENTPRPALPTFEAGRRYTHLYPDIAMIVLSVGRTLEGRTAITAQYVTGEQRGAVFAFLADSADAAVWR